MFGKFRARQGVAGPLSRTLGRLTGDYPKRIFQEHSIDRKGQVAGSYPSRVKPQTKGLYETSRCSCRRWTRNRDSPASGLLRHETTNGFTSRDRLSTRNVGAGLPANIRHSPDPM